MKQKGMVIAMKKLKDYFVNIFSIFETMFILIILIFGYPFYRKSLKEIWEMIKKVREERNKY